MYRIFFYSYFTSQPPLGSRLASASKWIADDEKEGAGGYNEDQRGTLQHPFKSINSLINLLQDFN